MTDLAARMTDLATRSRCRSSRGSASASAPRWHEGRLWYADFYAGTVLSASESGDVRVELEVPGEPAGLGWLPDGRLLVVARKPRTVLRLEADGRLVQHGDLNPTATFYGNDMVVDAAGRAYVGNFGFDLDGFIEERGQAALVEPPGPPTTALIRVDPDGSAHVAAEDLSFPNGTVITPDGRTLIVAETLAGRLTAFDVGDDGTLTGRRVWATLPWCAPDGICLDADGSVWVANAITTSACWWPRAGTVVDRVTTSQNCFACMLGGDDRRTLFVMTAPTSTESVVERDPDRHASSRPGWRWAGPGCPEPSDRAGRSRAAAEAGAAAWSRVRTGQWSRVRALRRLRTPWPMRCSFSMRANRTWSSPPGPKPTPGEVATSASVHQELGELERAHLPVGLGDRGPHEHGPPGRGDLPADAVQPVAQRVAAGLVGLVDHTWGSRAPRSWPRWRRSGWAGTSRSRGSS